MNENLKSVFYPLLLLLALLALWVVAVRNWGVPNYILPSFESVLAALRRGYIEGAFWKDFGYTMSSMLIGYVCGCSVAFVTTMAAAKVTRLPPVSALKPTELVSPIRACTWR